MNSSCPEPSLLPVNSFLQKGAVVNELHKLQNRKPCFLLQRATIEERRCRSPNDSIDAACRSSRRESYHFVSGTLLTKHGGVKRHCSHISQFKDKQIRSRSALRQRVSPRD